MLKKFFVILCLLGASLEAAEWFVAAGGYKGTAMQTDRSTTPATQSDLGSVNGTDMTLGLRFDESSNRLELLFDAITVGDTGLTGKKYQGALLNWVWNFDSWSFLGSNSFFISLGAGSYVIKDTSLAYTGLQLGVGFNIALSEALELEISGKRKNIFPSSAGTLSSMASYGYIGVRYFF